MKLGITDEDRKRMLLEGYKSEKMPRFVPSQLQYDSINPLDQKRFLDKVLPRGNTREIASETWTQADRDALMAEALARDEKMGYNKRFEKNAGETANMPAMNIYASDKDYIEPVVQPLEVQPLIPQTPMVYDIPKLIPTKIPEKSAFQAPEAQRLDVMSATPKSNYDYAKQWIQQNEEKRNRDKAVSDEITRRIDEIQNMRL